MPAVRAASRRVALVTLGCARNEVDSDELAGRLDAADWTLTDDSRDADVVVVNTCGFIDAAKKDSVDTLLAASGQGPKVVAVGCLAERYGDVLAAALPEADAVLGFDSYADIAQRLDDVAAGRPVPAHHPRDRRTLMPVAPVHRPTSDVAVPGHAWLPHARRRLTDGPSAYLKLASGCDRRCSFCAIPSFRGAFVSRPPEQVVAEARWLASQGVRELVLVSENSTSYGKDLGNLQALESLLPALAAVTGIDRIRVSYLQPAELRPSLLATIADTPGVAAYFDLSFQHASPTVLRRMRRFGSTDAFLDLLDRVRAIAPEAGVRSNVIIGFPGESEDDLAELLRFLCNARLDAIGVFGYSNEDGTEASRLDGAVPESVVAERVATVSAVADELVSQRAEERVGASVAVLVEDVEDGRPVGRAAHQGPDVDGSTFLAGAVGYGRGDIVDARVVATDGADLIAQTLP